MDTELSRFGSGPANQQPPTRARTPATGDAKMTDMKWTVYTKHTSKAKAWCQYADRERAQVHADAIGGYIALSPIRPLRWVEVTRRGCGETFRKCGLPQY